MKFIPPFTVAARRPEITMSLTKKLRKAGNLKDLPIIAGATILHDDGGALQILQTASTHNIYLLNRHTGHFEQLHAADDGSLRTADHVEPKPVDSDIGTEETGVVAQAA